MWAPEWYVLSKSEVDAADGAVAAVVFSAVVTPRCPRDFGFHSEGHRQRPYIMYTRDFVSFGAPRRLFDPPESAIDTIVFRGPRTAKPGQATPAHASGPRSASSSGDPPSLPNTAPVYALWKSEGNAPCPVQIMHANMHTCMCVLTNPRHPRSPSTIHAYIPSHLQAATNPRHPRSPAAEWDGVAGHAPLAINRS